MPREKSPPASGVKTPQRSSRVPPYVLRSSPVHGKGAFATRALREGEIVIEYTGEKITHAEADARYDDEAMEHHHTFLMVLNRKFVIDATVEGNEARFINHSCDPNCRILREKGRVFIVAKRPIRAGEEFAYDYAYDREEGDDEVATTRYACHCGAKICRGTILADES